MVNTLFLTKLSQMKFTLVKFFSFTIVQYFGELFLGTVDGIFCFSFLYKVYSSMVRI